MTYDDVVAALERLADEKLRAFNARIMYTRMRVYGVRTPDLRRLAARVKRECPDFAEGYFARQDPSHEELLICGMQTGKDAERNARLLERLIPRMDCWAHTDMVIDGMKWVKDAHAFLRRFDGLKAGGEFENAPSSSCSCNCWLAGTTSRPYRASWTLCRWASTTWTWPSPG